MVLTTAFTAENTARSELDDPQHPLNQLSAKIRDSVFKIILELKACEKITPIHRAQLLTYMKINQSKLGYLINFNEKLIKNGMHRFVL